MADTDKVDKKAEKARKKQEKKELKKRKKAGGDLDISEDEEQEGSKLAVFFVTLVIVVIWLAILVLLVKWDVGGFGSTVMTPIFKNVPYVNQILPQTDEGTELETQTEYPYQTLAEAVAYIKELELELQAAQQGQSDNSAYIAQLEAEAARLREYEAAEAEFEQLRENFYEEVVFSDNAPDIDTYRQYYESIDSANAESIYRQVVEQQQEDEALADYVSSYSKMKPAQAAAIFNTMTDNLQLVADILTNMNAQARADILGNMNAETAARVTTIMNPSE